MIHATGARAAVRQFAGIGLGIGNHFANRCERRLRVSDPDQRACRNQRDGHKLLHWVVVRSGRRSCSHRGEWRRHKQERVAIRCRVGNRLGTDGTTRADPIFHHHRLL